MTHSPATPLSSHEAYELISSVGNHEVKSMVLASMQPEVAYTVTPLHRRVMQLQGDTPAWQIHVNSPHEFCKTFANVGVVAEETVGANSARAFKITNKGRDLAKPLVGHLLELSLTEEQPLLAFFGPTQTNSDKGIRPSSRRVEMMRYVIDQSGDNIPSATLGTVLDVPIYHASQIAEDMAAYDLINRESSGRGKPTVFFSAEPSLWDIALRQDVGSDLLFDTVDVLKTYYENHPNGRLSNANIADLLTETGKYNMPSKDLIRLVSRKTNHYAHVRKVLKPIREHSPDKAREVISAHDEQLRIMKRVVNIVDQIKSPSSKFLKSGIKKVETITSDPDLVNELVTKARDNSIGRKGAEAAAWATRSQILQAIGNHPSAISVREIQEQLSAAGNHVDRAVIYKNLERLSKLGGLAMNDTPQGRRYTVAT